ncbi:MAG TPA: hypothetical protein PLI95_13660 [Polyangiaceae bacterium]|nr:hypothetical protein [Polyangiaceae bacterium]
MIRTCCLLAAAALALVACSSDDTESTDATPGADAAAESAITEDAAPDAAVTEDAAPDTGACKLSGVYSSSKPACNACAEEKCCVELNACFDAESCDDLYVNCMLGCALLEEDAGKEQIDACVSECGTEYPEGKTLYDAAMGCAETQCKAACE